MKRKILLAVMLFCLTISLAACGKEKEKEVIKAVDGFAEGRMGDILRNEFFEYSVDDAKFVDSYAGITATEGMQLLNVTITMKNVFTVTIPMIVDDFQVQWDGGGDEDYGYSLEAKDDTMIPEEFELKRGESKTYHAIYEVPVDSTDFSVSYLEIYEDNTEGDVFFVYFEIKK